MSDQDIARQQATATASETKLCMLAAFQILCTPPSLVDLGCGDGHLVELADKLGVPAMGFDIGVAPRQLPNGGMLCRHDLTRPLILTERAAWVLCLEVAEHLPPEAADTLCDTIADATGEVLLFSAATPGQGGAGHLNEQPRSYWRDRLRWRGLTEDAAATLALRESWASLAPNAWWYSRNVMAMRRLT